jgi:acetyltransferase-like isoleucine patch superfamily enzyme
MTKCKFCFKEIKADCDYNQGRCPHRKPMIEIQPKDTSKGHFYVSLIKSAIRIGAGVWLLQGNFVMAGVCLILAEVFGIFEELV